MVKVGHLIAEALDRLGDSGALSKIRGKVRELCRDFPLYPGMEGE